MMTRDKYLRIKGGPRIAYYSEYGPPYTARKAESMTDEFSGDAGDNWIDWGATRPDPRVQGFAFQGRAIGHARYRIDIDAGLFLLEWSPNGEFWLLVYEQPLPTAPAGESRQR